MRQFSTCKGSLTAKEIAHLCGIKVGTFYRYLERNGEEATVRRFNEGWGSCKRGPKPKYIYVYNGVVYTEAALGLHLGHGVRYVRNLRTVYGLQPAQIQHLIDINKLPKPKHGVMSCRAE